MFLGSHLSIAGGLHNALLEAERLRADTVQIFTKNQQQWRVRPLDPAAADEWLSHLRRLGWQDRTVSHASYLINLASPDDELWKKSVDLMTVEIERCEALSIPFLVHHPGAFTTSTADRGLRRIARAYATLLKRTRGYRTVCCLENTVGSGSNLGQDFAQLADLRARILDRTGAPDRVAFCLDTCHAHAGGYDLSTRAAAEAALADFHHHAGLHNVRVIHCNDSKAPLASRRDRHAHIGEGTITHGDHSHKSLSASGFWTILHHPAFRRTPIILETPKVDTPRGTPMDRINLRRLRKLIEPANQPIKTPRSKAAPGVRANTTRPGRV